MTTSRPARSERRPSPTCGDGRTKNAEKTPAATDGEYPRNSTRNVGRNDITPCTTYVPTIATNNGRRTLGRARSSTSGASEPLPHRLVGTPGAQSGGHATRTAGTPARRPVRPARPRGASRTGTRPTRRRRAARARRAARPRSEARTPSRCRRRSGRAASSPPRSGARRRARDTPPPRTNAGNTGASASPATHDAHRRRPADGDEDDAPLAVPVREHAARELGGAVRQPHPGERDPDRGVRHREVVDDRDGTGLIASRAKYVTRNASIHSDSTVWRYCQLIRPSLATCRSGLGSTLSVPDITASGGHSPCESERWWSSDARARSRSAIAAPAVRGRHRESRLGCRPRRGRRFDHVTAEPTALCQRRRESFFARQRLDVRAGRSPAGRPEERVADRDGRIQQLV